jgi:DNA-binding LacI/PurR family transcriptional regulator
MGVRAAKLLLDRIENGGGETSRLLLQPWLEVRGSTAVLGRR